MSDVEIPRLRIRVFRYALCCLWSVLLSLQHSVLTPWRDMPYTDSIGGVNPFLGGFLFFGRVGNSRSKT